MSMIDANLQYIQAIKKQIGLTRFHLVVSRLELAVRLSSKLYSEFPWV
jgi:hypothetical protein